MDGVNIERINELTALARQRELTVDEIKERKALRSAYLAAFRAGMQNQLENTVVQYPDGSRVSLRDAANKNNKK